jgi:hypothetical protein
VGKLTYDSTMVVNFDDRVLAHLQVVIGAKLRRGESFQMSWVTDQSEGSGRNVIWMDPAVPLGFKYDSARAPVLNRAWIEALMATAHSAGGLRIVPEPPEAEAQAQAKGPTSP